MTGDGDLSAGQRERVRRNSLLRVTITALFIIGKPAVRAREGQSYDVCGVRHTIYAGSGYWIPPPKEN